jgi:hypothetical protein
MSSGRRVGIGGAHALVRVLGLLRLGAAVELQPVGEILLAEQHAQVLLRLCGRHSPATRVESVRMYVMSPCWPSTPMSMPS